MLLYDILIIAIIYFAYKLATVLFKNSFQIIGYILLGILCLLVGGSIIVAIFAGLFSLIGWILSLIFIAVKWIAIISFICVFCNLIWKVVKNAIN